MEALVTAPEELVVLLRLEEQGLKAEVVAEALVDTLQTDTQAAQERRVMYSFNMSR